MSALARQRPIFHSEFDFQFSLCDVMEQAGVTRIRLERMVQLAGNPRFEIDIMGYIDENISIALELKYPKERLIGTVSSDDYHDESFNLPSSGAFDLDAHGIWKDASRIEKLLVAEIVEAGAVIALSNYKFWDERRHKRGTQAFDFRLWQGREVDAGAVLHFPEATQRQYLPVELRSPYLCDWQRYSEPLGSEFRYLVLAPESTS
jgi:hypothetical protein